MVTVIDVVEEHSVKVGDKLEKEERGADPPLKANSGAKNNAYPATPPDNLYHGPTMMEVGTNAVSAGLNQSKYRCAAHLSVLSFRWKASVAISLTAFILSTIVANSCNFVTIKRLYTNDQTVKLFGRGVLKGKLGPIDECKPWIEYPNLVAGARIEAARVGAIGCVILGALLILLLTKDAFCIGRVTDCFPPKMWRSLKFAICLLAAGFQALIQLLVWSHFCKQDATEGEDDRGVYVQTCSTDTSSFGISLAAISLFLIDLALVARQE